MKNEIKEIYLSNLEWCTYSRNNRHAREIGLNKGISYKIRCKKAIEYIKHEWFKREQIGISHLSFSYDELQKILDILNGDDE